MEDLRVGILTCLDVVADGEAEDVCGKRIVDACEARGWMTIDYHVCRLEFDVICDSMLEMCDVGDADIVLTIGACGVGVRDVIPDVTKHVCEREIPGFAEAVRRHVALTDPDAILSRATAGVYEHTLIVNLPNRRESACKAFEHIVGQFETAVQEVREGIDAQ